jgi:hypothetical protein
VTAGAARRDDAAQLRGRGLRVGATDDPLVEGAVLEGHAEPAGRVVVDRREHAPREALDRADLDEAGDASADLDPRSDADRFVGVLEHLDRHQGGYRRVQVAMNALDLLGGRQVQDQLVVFDA